MTRSELAARLALSHTTVSTRLKRLDLLPPRAPARARWTHQQIADELERRHADRLDIALSTMRVECPTIVRDAGRFGPWKHRNS